MRATTSFAATLTAVLLIVTACRTEAGAVPDAAEAPAKAKPYVLKVVTPTVKKGDKATATLEIRPAEGFKNNKEYPGKVTAQVDAGALKLSKTTFKQLAGDFEVSEKLISVKIPFAAKAAGEGRISCAGKISVCNERTCLIEKIEAEIVVTVAE